MEELKWKEKHFSFEFSFLCEVSPWFWMAALKILISSAVAGRLRHDCLLQNLIKHQHTRAAMKESACVSFPQNRLTFSSISDFGKQRQQLTALCQHGVNNSDAGAACLLKRLQVSPHELRLFSEAYLQLSSGYTVHTRAENHDGDCSCQRGHFCDSCRDARLFCNTSTSPFSFQKYVI